MYVKELFFRHEYFRFVKKLSIETLRAEKEKVVVEQFWV